MKGIIHVKLFLEKIYFLVATYFLFFLDIKSITRQSPMMELLIVRTKVIYSSSTYCNYVEWWCYMRNIYEPHLCRKTSVFVR